MLALWLVIAQLAMGWLVFVSIPDSVEWLMHYGGEQTLSGAAVSVLSFADEVRRNPVVWITWLVLVMGMAAASFRGRNWSIRMVVAFVALFQIAGVAWAYDVVETERERIRTGSAP